MIQVQDGDVLSVKSGIIVHGCNGWGVMGSGVALGVKTRFPGAFFAYRKAFEQRVDEGFTNLELGSITFHKADFNPAFSKDSKIIVNGVTQLNYGRDKNTVYVDYDAMREVFRKVNELALGFGIEEVHFPLIGCGLANGDWATVSGIIDEELDDRLAKRLWNFVP